LSKRRENLVKNGEGTCGMASERRERRGYELTNDRPKIKKRKLERT